LIIAFVLVGLGVFVGWCVTAWSYERRFLRASVKLLDAIGAAPNNAIHEPICGHCGHPVDAHDSRNIRECVLTILNEELTAESGSYHAINASAQR
jgi:hypothetical protein